ncbi:MAG: hypothetical protein HXY50_10640 [Ignavibacteriaceae bacterium]|nr:hypothetical protein [Ignavibacteriaceae bacterium]
MTMGKNVEILRLLCEPVDQAAINQLIEQTFKAALSYLHYNHKKISKIYIGEELSLEEVAISAITPLFCKDSQEHSIPIIKEAQSWQPPLRTENEALFFLNSVVGRRLEQHISYMLKEHDPFFAKILDSVNYLIKKNSYKRISYMGRKYIVNNNCDKINGKVID